MLRAIFPLILIANLLACPFRCALCEASEARVSECSPAACSCCHHESESSESPENSPRDDCLCPNCLCEGATLQDGIEVRDGGSQRGSFDHWLGGVRSDALEATERYVAPERDDRRWNDCGRNALIAYQSWLI